MGVLEGKVAVITGSSKGLGLAIAQAYEREGAAVVLASRSSAALAEALERQGARASWQVTDVGDLEQVKALADHAVKMFGKIDIWVNNAGYGGIYGPTATIDTQDFERVTRTNICGEYYGSWVALQHFLVQKTGGKLINLLGRGDITPVPFQNAYASSKAWVRNFTLALARGYKKKGIGIYALQPGLVDTDPLRRIASPKICLCPLHKTTSSRSVFHLCIKITSSLMLICKAHGSCSHVFIEADFSVHHGFW